jgi:Flp pilus assembly pilin Flp
MLKPNSRTRPKSHAVRTPLERLVRDVRGLSTVEYVIILVLVAAVCVATWSAFGNRVKDWLGFGTSTIDHELTGAPAGELSERGGRGSSGGGADPGPATDPEPTVKVKRKIPKATE